MSSYSAGRLGQLLSLSDVNAPRPRHQMKVKSMWEPGGLYETIYETFYEKPHATDTRTGDLQPHPLFGTWLDMGDGQEPAAPTSLLTRKDRKPGPMETRNL